MPPSTGSAADIATFWEAVAASSESLVADMMAVGGEQETPEFVKLADLLRTIHPDLLLTVGGGGGRPEIVISAGGIREAFPAVRAVADAAPEAVTCRYGVRAFRPRVPSAEGLRVRIKGREVTPEQIGWTARQDRRDPSRCDLTLYVPGIIEALPAASAANRSVIEPVFVLLDHLVGEWGVESQIGVIDWYSPDRVPPGAANLTSLPHYLDAISAESTAR